MSASSKKKLRKEQNAAQLTEKQLNEQKEAKKLKTQTIVFVVAVALVLAIGLASLSFSAYKASGITERLTTALTIGEHKLSSAELNYFYIDAINSTYQTWYNQYGDYTASYLSMLYGMDISKPLNEVIYDAESNTTLADYFVDMAVADAISAYTLYDLAIANNYVLTDENKATIDEAMENLSATSVSYGYQNVKDYLKSFYGNGASEKTFRRYLELATIASDFEADTYSSLSYTAEDLAAHNEKNFDNYSSFSYSTHYLTVNDFMICTASEDDKDHVHSQEEKDIALKATQDAADQVIAAKPANAEDFTAALKALSNYASAENATCIENTDYLYTSINNSQVAEWLVDSSRKIGDMTVIPNISETKDENGNTVTNTIGMTLVLFQGRNDNNMKLVNVRHILNAFTGATTDENGNTVYPKASIEKSLNAITELEKTWLSGVATEESFAELALLNTNDTGSVSTGGLYEDVYPGQMVPAFNDWCFDESRQPGDYGIVETEYGYHLMYFVGHSDISFRDFMIENDLRNADHESWYNEQIGAAKYTVNDTSNLKLDLVLLGN